MPAGGVGLGGGEAVATVFAALLLAAAVTGGDSPREEAAASAAEAAVRGGGIDRPSAAGRSGSIAGGRAEGISRQQTQQQPENHKQEKEACEGSKTRQVVVYARRNVSDWRHWPWDKMSAIIAIDFHDTELLRHARSRGVKYGLLVTHLDFPLFGKTMSYDSWVRGVASVMAKQQRDVIHFDLESIFRGTAVLDPHARVDFVRDFIGAIRREIADVEIGILHSWRVDCNQQPSQCTYLTSLLELVDYLISVTRGYHGSRQSATTTADPPAACSAAPRGSYGRVVVDIQSMIDCGVPTSRIIPLFNWRGTQYTCDSFDRKTGTCATVYCEETGSLMELEDVVKLRRQQGVHRVWNATFSAPYFSYYDSRTSKWRQVWYEDVQSLGLKYELVDIFQLRALGIWQPGSLVANQKDAHTQALEREMWHLIGPAQCDQLQRNIGNAPWKGLSVSIGPAIGLVLAGFLLGAVTVGSLLHYKYRRRHVLHASCDDDAPTLTGEVH